MTNIEFNFQTIASQIIVKSNSILNVHDNASQRKDPQENQNFSLSIPLTLKNLIFIRPLNRNQREIRVDPIIIDKLVSNSTLGNITNNPSGTPWTTIDGTCSNSLGIIEQTPFIVTSLNNNREINIDFDYQIVENDDTNSIEKYYNILQQPSDLILQPGEILVFSKDGDEDYDNLDIYLVDQNIGNSKIISRSLS